MIADLQLAHPRCWVAKRPVWRTRDDPSNDAAMPLMLGSARSVGATKAFHAGVLFFICWLLSDVAIAQNLSAVSIEELVAHLTPGNDGVAWAGGELANDDFKCIAVYVSESGGPQNGERLLILKSESHGTYKLIAQSLPDISLEGTRTTRFVRIKKDSIFIGVSGPSDYESVETQEFQFKYRDDGFYLVGFRLSNGKNAEADDREISVNYLTGDKIEWRKTGAKRREVKSTKMVTPLVRLELFPWNAPNEDYQWSIDP